MQAILSRWLDKVRTGFWFLPMLMLAAAAGLALLLLHVDRVLDPGTESSLAWAYSGGPEGARSLLSTIAGSMITAASVTFSLASVALSIASQQYGSRMLRNFMRDRITQVLLGTFVATFIYSVLVIRTIRGSDFGGGFVPAISVTVAIVLSLASLVLLIYFIHHVSASIQAANIIRVIAEDMEAAIPKLYPSESGEPLRSAAEEVAAEQGSFSLVSERSGYIQTVDLDALMTVAQKQNVVVQLQERPGDQVLAGAVLLKVPGRTSLDRQCEQELAEAFYIDRERTPAQDIRYQFQQLTDVVIRALSPGINDPFTAINGIDELAAALRLLAKQPTPSERRTDSEHHLRLIVPTTRLAEVLDETVGHIALYAKSDRFVMRALLRALAGVSPHLQHAADRATAKRLAEELQQS